MKGNMHVIKE